MPKDFSGQNLRGRSFKGQNLEGANFSYADIRGANFSGVNLTGANFSHAKAGLQRRWVIFAVLLSWLFSGFAGFYLFLCGYLVSLIFDTAKLRNQICGWTMLIVLIVFFSSMIYRGVRTGSQEVELILILFLVLVFPLAIPFAYAGTFAICCGIVGVFAFAWAFSGVFAFAFLRIISSTALIVATGVAGTVVLLNIYVGWRAMKGDEKYSSLRNLALTFAATGGTSFLNANLTNADFSQATLKSTDFRNSILMCSHWHQAKMLDRVRPGLTYLQNSQVRQLLVTGQGQDKNFDRQNLRGINLQTANLADASFIGADLSEANLQDADLSRAKLKQTQIDGTDLTGATLTGAFIEDWGITNTTKLHGVSCEYIFMRLPTKEDPDPLRKPDNKKEVFADGDFADFIQPIFDTLDLYHNQGVDPRAIAISFKQLAENHPDAELEIVAMEKRGQDKFLLRAKTAATADKSELSAEYFDTYNEIKALPEREIKLLLEEKDSRIRSLENFVTQALQRPSFYSNVEQVGIMTNNPRGFSVGGSVGGNVNNVQGDNNKVVQGDGNMSGDRNINTGRGRYNEQIQGDYYEQNGNFGIGHMSGGEIKQGAKVAGVINEVERQNLAQAAAEIQKLLEQLDKSYPSNSTVGKMAIATETIKQIDSDPTLAARILSALKAGGVSAFEQFLNHPAASFVIGALEDWKNSKET